MISELFVRNYALIDELSIDFSNGFSTLTGETGAGKSIILGALGLALGQRADLKALKNPEEKAIVEVHVQVAAADFESLFIDAEVDFESHTILRREILPSGKSRAFINDTPVRIDALQQIGSRLIDIHSQHDTLLLNDVDFQLSLIDKLAANTTIRTAYGQAFEAYRKLLAEQSAIAQADTAQGGDLDYLTFLNNELEDAKIKSGEETFLMAEIGRLSNLEESTQRLAEVTALLTDLDVGALALIRQSVAALRPASAHDEEITGWMERLASVAIELDDIATDLSAKEAEDVDPERLLQLDMRLQMLQNLFHKHKVDSTEDLLQKHDAIAAALDLAASREERRLKIDAEIEGAREQLTQVAEQLTESRAATLPQLTQKVTAILEGLNMMGARLEITLHPRKDFATTGNDLVQFAFSANRGLAPQPLTKIASGGELSRVMLALKAILSETEGLPTIIFDEIDTGISGDTATKVAHILREMGLRMQVIAITHLPQIAAAGKRQYRVSKSQEGAVATTVLKEVLGDDRLHAIAKMLSGEQLTPAALANAQELMAIFENA